ncbi:carboxypeptidase regulatory-like domain-containing protein [Paraburkholderia sprentiae WSM5005]|uniref:Carboxypeptidase regulatory-like domain-containing protein n=1 Tax=Paraburkholderia sprentiae WSM5005 TaxID=754502 RepID=A0A1I9YN45_9BURK|nr:carboxypeptidase regulatory-like domain-containing protein [Paraburkholderia sprentiae]APA87728.1 carboxypeptidase regulatory-like domain-containing protein [Paraburkholderia sprentiae WSM5005]
MKRTSVVKVGFTALALAASVQYAFAASQALPAVQHEGEVTFLTGGIGLGQSAAIKEVMPTYPLTLEFAGKTASGNDYLANVPVQVSDMHGHTVLKTTTTGPFLLASLPHGRYSVTATYNGKIKRRDVDIAPSSHVHDVFLWPM